MENWVSHMKSTMGGDISEARAKKYMTVVTRFLRHIDCFDTPYLILQKLRPHAVG
jgi:hypothetical protein